MLRATGCEFEVLTRPVDSLDTNTEQSFISRRTYLPQPHFPLKISVRVPAILTSRAVLSAGLTISILERGVNSVTFFPLAFHVSDRRSPLWMNLLLSAAGRGVLGVSP